MEGGTPLSFIRNSLRTITQSLIVQELSLVLMKFKARSVHLDMGKHSSKKAHLLTNAGLSTCFGILLASLTFTLAPGSLKIEAREASVRGRIF